MATHPDHTETLRLPPRHQGLSNTIWTTLGALMFGGFLVAGIIWTAPALISDWQIRAEAQPLANASVREGKCSAKVMFNFCDLTVQVQTPTGLLTRDINYVFTGVQLGDYNVRAMVDPAHPELASTDLGLDRLWNRTITLLTGGSLLLALSVLPLLTLLRRRNTR